MAAAERLVCASADLQEGGVGVRFELEQQGTKLPAFAVRFDGTVRAFLNRCAHVPVELDWQPGHFFDDEGLYLICATHGAIYEPDTGRCVAGPCVGQHLVPLGVVEREGCVMIAVSQESN